MDRKMRTLPNILITGTPGTGKSTLAQQVSEGSGLDWVDVSQIAKDNKFFEGFDSDYGCHVLNEEKLLDEIEDQMEEGGKVVDYHGCDFFPQRWFDIVFVLRTDNTRLYDRLVSRGYTGKKLEENIQCEIFQTILDEARDSYEPSIVFELPSNTSDDMENNLEKIVQWVEQYKNNVNSIEM
jgi:adenylate kinase